MSQIFPDRKLLIFADPDLVLKRQQSALIEKEAAGIKERELTVVLVKKEKNLYEKYKVKYHQFTVILIGKDGYEKYRTNNLLEMIQLFSIIDAMPMRKNEMKKTN